MTRKRTLITVTAFVVLAAQTLSCVPPFETDVPAGETPIPERADETPDAAPTPIQVQVQGSTDEPILITGVIPYTSPFFEDMLKDSFVLLEDEAGFIQRDLDFEFPRVGQAMGPVEFVEEGQLIYSLVLPGIPQGTLVDVDHDGEEDTGVQVFAVAYWSNTWGDPFLEPRDGTGWSGAYASTVTDANRNYEIAGGTLIVWAPDDQQEFPTGFGEDEMLFTDDDPVGPIPAGYNVVNLDQEPFAVHKEPQPEIALIEGEGAVSDYSDLGYEEAFDALCEQMSYQYAFTEEKGIDWDALCDEFAARAAGARNDTDYYRVIRDFAWTFPDGHVGAWGDSPAIGNVFFEEQGGSFGLILAELSDGRVIVTHVLPDTPGAEAGIEIGAEIVEWNGQPVGEAIAQVIPYFGPYSTAHHRRIEQVAFLTRVPPFEEVAVTFRNPGAAETEVTMTADIEYDSLFMALPYFAEDVLTLPVAGEVLDESGLGYINLATFSANYNLMADLWDHYLNAMIENDVPGLIIDLRLNGGGNGALALDFVGTFFDEEIVLSQFQYYNELTGAFEPEGLPERIEPGPLYYDGPIAVLVGPYCVSACESFAYAITREGRAIVVGHFPTAGAFGDVGRGQVDLPGELSLQFPTGRSETPDGELVIEGVGIVPDIGVPVTEESVLGLEDPVLDAAIEALLD